MVSDCSRTKINAHSSLNFWESKLQQKVPFCDTCEIFFFFDWHAKCHSEMIGTKFKWQKFSPIFPLMILVIHSRLFSQSELTKFTKFFKTKYFLLVLITEKSMYNFFSDAWRKIKRKYLMAYF